MCTDNGTDFCRALKMAIPLHSCANRSRDDFEPIILTLPQVLEIFDNLDLMRRTMILTDAATALRVSEELALQWLDLDFAGQLIRVRRAYVQGRFGKPKSKASKAPVPMHPLLAAHLLAWRKQTPYPKDEDLVFPSLRLKGAKPPAANMLVADYLRVAAKKAGVEAPPRTFGFHTFRRTLASVLVKMKVDVKVRAGNSPAPEFKNDAGDLCQGHDRRQARSPGYVPRRALQPRSEEEKFTRGTGSS